MLEASWAPDAFVCILCLAVTFSLPLLQPYMSKDMHETQDVLRVLLIIQHCVIPGDSSTRPGVWHLTHAKKEAEPVHKQL